MIDEERLRYVRYGKRFQFVAANCTFAVHPTQINWFHFPLTINHFPLTIPDLRTYTRIGSIQMSGFEFRFFPPKGMTQLVQKSLTDFLPVRTLFTTGRIPDIFEK